MKEYRILQQIGNGYPFSLYTFNSLSEAKRKLEYCISDYDEKKIIYYIDNDFFDNKYILGLPKLHYFQIQEREVTDWVKLEDNKNSKKEKTKIIYLNNY